LFIVGLVLIVAGITWRADQAGTLIGFGSGLAFVAPFASRVMQARFGGPGAEVELKTVSAQLVTAVAKRAEENHLTPEQEAEAMRRALAFAAGLRALARAEAVGAPADEPGMRILEHEADRIVREAGGYGTATPGTEIDGS
jgi:hypothetical protein